mmetsp:Transcript_46129/g.128495  ORF Transcript_46129/g.128495 Transcript_46129/m.128495 type:complete len:542 (+) Transcript_46129:547-2172(+)
MAVVGAASKWRTGARKKAMRRKLSDYLDQVKGNHDDVLDTVLRNISAWNFDVFEVAKLAPNAPLVFIGYMMYMSSNLSAAFRISDAKLLAFLTEVDRGYLQNPYHNRLHGTDVAHSMHHLLSSGGLSRHMTNWQHLAALTSALCHDLGHFALTNPFLTETHHEVALTYYNRSPLESMHISKVFQILSKEECDIFEMLTGDVSRLVRNLMVDMILATDMAVHGLHLTEFENMIDASDDNRPEMSDPATSKLILQVALHAVDISNPAKDWDYYIKWTDRVLSEFHSQGDQERELGLPISPGFDRLKMTNIKQKAAGQMFFIGVLVKPLYEAFGKLSYVDIDEPMYHLEQNLAHWKQIVEKFDQEEKLKEALALDTDAKDVEYSDTESEDEEVEGGASNGAGGGRSSLKKKGASGSQLTAALHEEDPTEEDNAEVHGKIIEFVTQDLAHQNSMDDGAKLEEAKKVEKSAMETGEDRMSMTVPDGERDSSMKVLTHLLRVGSFVDDGTRSASASTASSSSAPGSPIGSAVRRTGKGGSRKASVDL